MTVPPQGPQGPHEPHEPQGSQWPAQPPQSPGVPLAPRSFAQAQAPGQGSPGWNQGVGRSGVSLRISRRLLWVDDAVYPLHNVVRVQSLVLKPNRRSAVIQFGQWMVLVVVLFALLSGFGNGLPLILLALMIFLIVQLVQRLTRPDVLAMVVETSGAPAVVVTLAEREDLRRLVRRIAEAIENPEKELSVYVHQVHVKLGDYHFGDTVNIHGGSGNKGILK